MKMAHIGRVLLGVVCLLLMFVVGEAVAEEASPTDAPRTMTAVRINPTPPKIDGVLDDKIWQHAPISGDFTQREPNEGEKPTENTTVQVVYDDEALYIGIVAYDREPEKIVARLTRRDGWTNSDRVSVNLDPHHDHQTGYYFNVNAAGVLGDGSLYNDTSADETWNGVWDARTSIHEQGWSVEYKIPFHVLRFTPKAEYTWGINVSRSISRKKEEDFWVTVPRKESGMVSRFGHLEGIRDIKPPKHLEVLPFALGRTTFATDEDEDFFSSVGTDVRYGLTSNFSINATLNPDFGQVEADPAVLNLSVFESFFDERRPFFVEGAQSFETPFNLFYSRRIGKAPGRFEIPDGFDVVEKPEATTILGAAKLTGKTEGKTTFGLLEAVTGAEDATIKNAETGEVRTHRIEPRTNYLVGRIKQDILDGNSNIGGLLTAVNRDNAESAYTGGVDWNLRLKNAYRIMGQAAGSHAGAEGERGNGYAAQAQFSKISGRLRGDIDLKALSPDFRGNDLGFIERVDRIRSRLWLGVREEKPWAIFRRNSFNVNSWADWNYDGLNLQNRLNFNTWHQFRNFWWIGGGFTRQFEALDDLKTRGGPAMVTPAGIQYWVFVDSDSRKTVGGWFEYSRHRDDGGSKGWSIYGGLRFHPASNIEIRFSPEYRWGFDNAQWVTNVDNNGDGTDDRFVFGELTSKVIDLTTRVNVSFTRDLSLELYLQPFIAVGNYENFKELARPESYEFTPYMAALDNPDFNNRSLRSNLVLRWEYRPGSTLFLVWSQSRSHDTNDPTLEFLESLGDSFSDKGSNIFLAKLNYWLGL